MTNPNKDTQPQGVVEQALRIARDTWADGNAKATLNFRGDGSELSVDQSAAAILALINSEADRRVREFAMKVKAQMPLPHQFHCPYDAGMIPAAIDNIIDAALTQSGGTES